MILKLGIHISAEADSRGSYAWSVDTGVPIIEDTAHEVDYLAGIRDEAALAAARAKSGFVDAWARDGATGWGSRGGHLLKFTGREVVIYKATLAGLAEFILALPPGAVVIQESTVDSPALEVDYSDDYYHGVVEPRIQEYRKTRVSGQDLPYPQPPKEPKP